MKNADLIKGLEKLGLTQNAIAQSIGTTQATVSRIKKGAKTNSDLERGLRELAMQYGVITEPAGRLTAPAPRDFIDEVDVYSGMGGGGLTIIDATTENGITFANEAVRDHWRVPTYVLAGINAQPRHIKAFPCRGDSMEPTIHDGDVVFVDTRHKVPSPPGVYVMADEFGGVVTKRLEVISRPSDDPVIVRVSSDNPNHRDRELTMEEIHIIGRYIGRFTR